MIHIRQIIDGTTKEAAKRISNAAESIRILEADRVVRGRYGDGQPAYRSNVPRDRRTGVPSPLDDASGAHNRLQYDGRDPKRIYSATEFDRNGRTVGRTDFAGRKGQEVPHYHPYDPSTKGFGAKQPLPR